MLGPRMIPGPRRLPNTINLSNHAPRAGTAWGRQATEMDRKQVTGRNQSEGAGHSLLSFSGVPQEQPQPMERPSIDSLLARYPCVAAYLNGHNHAGNYGERDGIHYLTLKGMVDTEKTAYAVIEVYPDRLAVKGFGRETDREMPLSERAK